MLNGFIVSKLVFKCFTHVNNKFYKTGKANQYVNAGTRCIFVLAKLIWCPTLCFEFFEKNIHLKKRVKNVKIMINKENGGNHWVSMSVHKLVSPKKS